MNTGTFTTAAISAYDDADVAEVLFDSWVYVSVPLSSLFASGSFGYESSLPTKALSQGRILSNDASSMQNSSGRHQNLLKIFFEWLLPSGSLSALF